MPDSVYLKTYAPARAHFYCLRALGRILLVSGVEARCSINWPMNILAPWPFIWISSKQNDDFSNMSPKTLIYFQLIMETIFLIKFQG